MPDMPAVPRATPPISPDIAGLLPLRTVLPAQTKAGRLDCALETLMPGLSLRARRRLWQWCRISVNGRAALPGSQVSAGDTVTIHPLSTQAHRLSAPCSDHASASVSIIAGTEAFVILLKPAGLHSARLAGGEEDSLERRFTLAWPFLRAEWTKERPSSFDKAAQSNKEEFAVPLLLTRLDKYTSGLVLAARHKDAAGSFRELERLGLVRKRYFALVRGELERSLLLTRRLVTDNRAQTLELAEDDPDHTRHSYVKPLHILNSDNFPEQAGLELPCTLVQVDIKRGARHQIRVHLAGAGFPLLGERLYPSLEKAPGGPRLYLHHARLEMPDFSACRIPDWGKELEEFWAGSL